jgi:hypothetical protein
MKKKDQEKSAANAKPPARIFEEWNVTNSEGLFIKAGGRDIDGIFAYIQAAGINWKQAECFCVYQKKTAQAGIIWKSFS